MTTQISESGLGSGPIKNTNANVVSGTLPWENVGGVIRSGSGFKASSSAINTEFCYIDPGPGTQKVQFGFTGHTAGEHHIVFDKIAGTGFTYDGATGASTASLALRISVASAGYMDFRLIKRNTTTGAAEEIWSTLWLNDSAYTGSIDWSSGDIVVTIQDGAHGTNTATISTARSGGQFAGVYFYTSNASCNAFLLDGVVTPLISDIPTTMVAGVAVGAHVTGNGAPVAGAAVTSANTTALPNPGSTTDVAGAITLNPASASAANFNVTTAKSGFVSEVKSVGVAVGATGGGTLGMGISPTSITVPEGATALGTLTSSLTGTLTWSKIGGPDAARVNIDSASGAVTPVAALDFEAPTDADANNVYEVDFQVTNGSATIAARVQIIVQNQVEAVVVSPNPITGLQGQTVTVTVRDESNNPIPGAALAWSTTSGGTISGVTNSAGQATIALSATPGTHNLIASFGPVNSVVPVVISAYPALNSVTTSSALGGEAGGSEVITVTVLDANGDPAQGAAVNLIMETAGVASATSGTTNSSGQCNITVSYLATGMTAAYFQASRYSSSKASSPETLFVQPVVSSGQVPGIEAQAGDTNPKFDEELYPYVFDFSPFLAEDETIIEVKSVTCKSTPASFDPASASMLIGVPVIHGQKVVQFVNAGKKGGIYVLRCTVRATRATATAEIRLRVFAVAGKRAS